MPKWKFPVNDGGEKDGFNHSGIETFRGDRYGSLGREIIQNSLDAKAPDSDRPVIVDFSMRKVDTNNIPGIKQLKGIISACSRDKQAKEEPKAISFFKRAKTLLNQTKLDVLQISDYNTTGLSLEGYRDCRGSFFALTKGKGTGEKGGSSTSGGSYGIGQNAPFAVSDLRCVFYSSNCGKGDEQEFHFQGKSILLSHKDPQSKTQTRGTGYWGKEKGCQPMKGGNAPDWLKRRAISKKVPLQGTSISIVGFQQDAEWKTKLIYAVISNFFISIIQNKLEVVIGGESINSSNIGAYWEREGIDELMGFEEANAFFKSFSSSKSVGRSTEHNALGFCEIQILVEEGAPRRVALARKTGMVITSSLLQRFRGVSDFCAVFICKGDAGNRIIRAMEPPCHDDIQPDRIEDPVERKQATKALKSIQKWIREQIKDVAGHKSGPVEVLRDLAEFFPSPDDESIDAESENAELDPEGATRIALQPVKIWSSGNSSAVGENETTDMDSEGDGETDGPDDGQSSGSGGKVKTKGSKKPLKRLQLSKIRQIPSSEGAKITFVPEVSHKQVELKLFLAGDSLIEPITVTSWATGGTKSKKPKKAPIKISMTAGSPVEITVSFRDFDASSNAIIVSAFEQKPEKGVMK